MKLFPHKITNLFIAIMALLTTNSCIDDNFDTNKLSTHIENKSQWGVPLINTSFNVEDIVKLVDSTGFVSTYNDGLVVIVYSDTIYSAIAEEEIVFPNQDYDTIFIKDDYDAQGWTMIKNRVDFLFLVAAENQLLDSVTLKSADVTIRVQSTFKYTGTLTLTFPELKKDGQPYQKIINIDDNTGNFNSSYSFSDAKDYKVDFTNFTEPNTFLISYKLDLNESSGNGTIENNAICDVDVDIQNIKYDFVWGYAGEKNIALTKQSLKLGLFETSQYGTFDLYDPKIIVNIKNSFGVPAGFHFTTLQMRVGENDTWLDVTGAEIPAENSLWYIPITEMTYPSPLQLVDTTIKVTGQGSNLDTLISQIPDYIEFSGETKLNPNGYTGIQNFFSSQSKVEAIMDLELPLWGKTENLTFVDTMELDLNKFSDQSDYIEFINLHIDIANGLPHDIKIKGYLMDSLYNIVDSIPNSNDTPFAETLWLIKSGNIGTDSIINQTTGKTLASTTIKYEGSGVDNIQGVKYLKFQAWLVTTNGTEPDAPIVKYFDFYGMDIDISVDVKVNVNENF